MLNRFGKLIRDIRITRSILLYDMAKDLNISPSNLSAIECGRVEIPDWFIPAVSEKYNIGDTCTQMLYILAKERIT